MRTSALRDRLAARVTLPAAVLLAGVALNCALACAGQPGPPPTAAERRNARAAAANAEDDASFRKDVLEGGLVVASPRYAAEYLWPRLPPPVQRATPAAERLTITRQPGALFFADTYTITAVGDFDPVSARRFSEHVRSLQNLLRPRPQILLHLRRDEPTGVVVVADLELK